MTEETAKEAHSLRSEKGALQRRIGVMQSRVNKIDARILAIKWSEYPIGCRVKDSRGDEYEVGGYSNYWLLGHKIKKDGTRGSKMVNIYGEVVKI